MEPQPFKCHRCHSRSFTVRLTDIGLTLACLECHMVLPVPLSVSIRSYLSIVNPIPAERPVHENEGLPCPGS